jgi:hypothetical protein
MTTETPDACSISIHEHNRSLSFAIDRTRVFMSTETRNQLKEGSARAGLLLRGHCDFETRAACEGFVREAVMHRNRRKPAAFRIEREQLQACVRTSRAGYAGFAANDSALQECA